MDTSGVTTEPQGTGQDEGPVTIERDITMSEAARRLGYGKRRMLQLLRSGAIPTAYQSEGGRWYIQPSGLEQYTRERSNAG